jgi:O-methyltransferase
MRLFLIRYIKIAFVSLRLHVLFNWASSFFQNLVYLAKFSAWANKNKKIGYNDFPSKWDYQKRYPLYRSVLERENLLEAAIDYVEFGVADGYSFKWFLAQNRNPDSRFYGFDTFTGLPEDFGVYKKGTFNTNHRPPEISDSRGRFYQGLFQQTVPGFLSNIANEKRKVIMMDADLYSSTLFALTSLAPFLKQGDIIFFDEFAVPTHEFKAFSDFTQSYYIDLKLIAAANNYYFSAFRVNA